MAVALMAGPLFPATVRAWASPLVPAMTPTSAELSNCEANVTGAPQPAGVK
jgi:hypothetical protein